MLTVDEVEQIRRKKVAIIIGHVFQLTCAAYCDKLVHEEKVNRCHGCAIQHPNQKQHSCLMLDIEDAWFYYHDEAREQRGLTMVMQIVESVCQTWESYLTELPKLSWISLYLTSLELENYGEDMKCGLKTNDLSSLEIHKDDNTEEVMNVDPIEMQCPGNCGM